MNLSNKYSPGYVDNVFAVWYEYGKPSAPKLLDLIPECPINHSKPTKEILNDWMNKDEWKERSESLDLEVQENYKAQQVKSKVEMLERHAALGREMQDMAMGWLQTHSDELTPGTAVRLLVDGINTERSTAGIPEALQKMINMSDEELNDQIAKLLSSVPVDADN